MKRIVLLAHLIICAPCMCMLGQNAPVTRAATILTLENTATVNITVTGFTDIGSCGLQITYDAEVAAAVSVASDPLIPGNMNANLTEPGRIIIGWYTWPGISLPDSTALFSITFERRGYGATSLAFNNEGNACNYGDGNSNILNDLPTTDYYVNGSLTFTRESPVVIAGTVKANPGSMADVAVSTAGFENVGSMVLTLKFDPAVLDFQSWENTSEFPGLTLTEPYPGTLFALGTVDSTAQPVTITDSSTLIILHFAYSGGFSLLEWQALPDSCRFSGPPPAFVPLYDIPQSGHYINGSVSSAVGQTELPGTFPAVSFYPNPCRGTGVLTISTAEPGDALIEIISMTGTVVYASKTTVACPETTRMPLSLTDYVPGVYLLKVILQTPFKSHFSSTRIIKVQ